ncbi:hypothetical protein FW774_19110 [Pedobacter sp. BS3]|uniref:hypothetical protein n=1 Tax=Pedobacter sp. BS3 TaxID=2567937 RepID=UPI0011F07DF0|nr:hypothetical protein [Pedobacter sp. BS3]TZF81163.1 hypothetical protein FW774_19110 [Pedobacter sp. BS3]
MKTKDIMKTSSLLTIAAGAAALGAAWYFNRKETMRMGQKLADEARDMGKRTARYARRLKNKLLHHITGPNGEAVYTDMYDRMFYEDEAGRRIYMQPESV